MNATATLLPNGKVLVAGGATGRTVSFPEVVGSADLYDPITGKFTATGALADARSDATATLLRDGRVLIAGGYGCGNVALCSGGSPADGRDLLATAELYDPATGTFARTGSMTVARADATATLLRDGRVLMLNGRTEIAEIYDPATGRFARTGSLLNYYTYPTATLLPNGTVLVVGDSQNISDTQDEPRAEAFDPATGESTSITLPIPEGAAEVRARGYGSRPTSTALADGRVLLSLYDFLTIYDPTSGTFAASGSISAPDEWLEVTATLLADGRVLFAGGGSTSAGLFDPVSGFQATASMTTPRWAQTATLLPDGSVLIAGGSSDRESALASAELYRP
jgi:hypothetical protein